MDSPLTSFNASALVDPSLGFRGCNDYVGWGKILNKLAKTYPAESGVKWAIAGRRKSALEAVASSVGAAVPVLCANSSRTSVVTLDCFIMFLPNLNLFYINQSI